MSFGVKISVNKPRSQNYETLDPDDTTAIRIAGIRIEVLNTRNTPVYLTWKV
jgi:hypothetical protein